MKKKSLILLPAMMLLAACGPTEGGSTTSKSSDGGDTPSVVNYGTLETPLTVSEFLLEADKLQLENQAFSEKHFFVKGVAQSYFTWNSSYKNYDKFQLGETKTSEVKIDVTGMQKGTGVDDVYQGDTFVVEGLAEKYKDALCIYFNKDANDYPAVRALLSRGESSVKATVTNGKVEGLMAKYENGKTAEFTVTADSGFKVDSVKVYGGALVADSTGKYSFTVAGDANVEVTTIADAPVTHLARYDFSTLTGKGTALDAAGLKTAFDECYKDGASGNILSEVTSVEKVYNGNQSGGFYNEKPGVLKFGTSSLNGSFTIKLTVAVNKVTLNYHDFFASSADYPTTTNKFSVNGVEKANPYTSDGTPEDVVFELTSASDTLEFKATKRAILFAVVFE